MKPVEAWAIVAPKQNTIPAMMEDKSDLLDWIEDEIGESWDQLKIEGYRCVRVRIEEVENEM